MGSLSKGPYYILVSAIAITALLLVALTATETFHLGWWSPPWQLLVASNTGQESSTQASSKASGAVSSQPDPPIPASLRPATPTAIMLQHLNITMMQLSYAKHDTPEGDVLPLHWVIKACYRPYMGRTLSSTLLSGLFNGLRPATISIAWCKPYTTDQLPSFIYNMRHSHEVNIFFADERMGKYADLGSTTVALAVPHLLNQTDLHLLITEDDVLLAPNINARIRSLVKKARRHARKDPYYINLYRGNVQYVPFDSQNTTGLTNSVLQSVPDDYIPPGKEEPASGVDVVQQQAGVETDLDVGADWGAQAQLCSPHMTPMLLDYYVRCFLAKEAGNTSDPYLDWSVGFADIVTWKAITQRYKCNEKGSRCHAFLSRVSLVQHTGTSSTLNNVGAVNKKFHTGLGFPVRVHFPGLDPHDWW